MLCTEPHGSLLSSQGSKTSHTIFQSTLKLYGWFSVKTLWNAYSKMVNSSALVPWSFSVFTPCFFLWADADELCCHWWVKLLHFLKYFTAGLDKALLEGNLGQGSFSAPFHQSIPTFYHQEYNCFTVKEEEEVMICSRWSPLVF